MPLPRSPEGAVEINRGCDPRSTRPLTRLFPAPRRGAGHPSRLASSPPPSPAPLRGAGERKDTLPSRGLHPWLLASRPSGACPLFPLRTFSMLYLCLFLLCLAGSRIASGLRNCSGKLQRYLTNTGKNGAVRARPADCVMTKRAGNNRLPRLQAKPVFVQEPAQARQ